MAETTNNTPLLEKAAQESISKSLGRMAAATESFNTTMARLHKAHHDDMSKAYGGLAKALGVEGFPYSVGGNGEPGSVDIEKEGTKNLQDFEPKGPWDHGAAPRSDPPPAPGEKAAPAGTLTKDEVAAMIKAEREQTVNDTVSEVLTALFGKGHDADDLCPNCHLKKGECKCAAMKVERAAPAAGIGDRGSIAPVVRGETPLTKGGAIVQDAPMTDSEREDVVRKAANGDTDAILRLMKGARPTDVPTTLVEPLSKIH